MIIIYFTIMSLFVLFESAMGYGLFRLKNFDDTNTTEKKVQAEIADFGTFSTIAQLTVHYA